MKFTPEQIMDNSEIMGMAREAGFPFNKYGLLQADSEGEIEADEMFARFAALVAAKEREAIAEEWHQRIGSDLEYGVRWVNVRESKRFKEVYPQAAGFTAWLSARGQKGSA